MLVGELSERPRTLLTEVQATSGVPTDSWTAAGKVEERDDAARDVRRAELCAARDTDHFQHLQVNVGLKGEELLRRSFSAVCAATIARKDALCSVFRDLQDSNIFAPLRPQRISQKMPKLLLNPLLNCHGLKSS